MREVDLTGARCAGATMRHIDMSGALLGKATSIDVIYAVPTSRQSTRGQ
jgi:hypothetical protein